MKAHFRFLCLCVAMLCIGAASRAQLSGSITVPSTTYPTLDSVIKALNAQGVGASSVVINFTAATNETAPVGGYKLGSAVLNASTSAAKTVTINGNANVITGYVGTSTADGIFYIQGTDYVTINNLKLIDTNTASNTTKMEWGFSLVKLSGTAPFDGCQNDVINGCTITLSGTYSATMGIRAAHTLAGTTTVLTTTGTTAASTNSYNLFTANIITGVTRGINLVGISSGVAVYDKANRIGGATASTGNTITIGGSSNTSYSVYTQYDSVITVQNNTMAVATGQSTSFYHYYPANGVGNLSVLNNKFNMACSMTSGTAYAFYNYGISSQHSDPSSGINSASTHTITGNIISGDNTVATTSNSVYAIYEYYAYCKYLNVSNNTMQNMNWNLASSMYMVYTYYNLSPYINIDNNTIYNITDLYTSGYIYTFYCYHYGSQYGLYSNQNNVVRKIKSNYYIYQYLMGSGTTAPTGYTSQPMKYKYNVYDSLDFTSANSGTLLDYIYYGMDSTEVSYNRVTNIQGPTTGTLNLYVYTYGYYAPYLYTVRGNLISNITAVTLNNSNQLGYYSTMCDSNVISNFNVTGTSGSIYNYLGMYTSGSVTSNNRINNINTNGCILYNYIGYNAPNAIVKYNAITNCNLLGSNGYLYNMMGYASTDADIHHNRVDSITQGTSNTFYPFYGYASGAVQKIHENVVSNLTTASTSISFYPYYLFSSGASVVTQFYNNTVSNINVPTAFNNVNSAAVYLSSASPYTVYNNTIRINPGITGSANLGFTGIYYNSGALLDLRNNIINVNVTPAGTGFTTALRRSAGTAGINPSNFLGTSNGNIYYAPNTTNSWLYGEGTSAASMVNTFNLTNDANFNTPCGKFKSFTGHDQASFTENNLVAGTLPGTYVPSGVSYAEKGGVPTTNPPVITDYAGVTRGPVVDMGALEFAGTPLDNAPPIISYTPVPVRSYCSSEPTLFATITDNSGVNNTMAPGTGAPRLYYKKSSENNVFGGANNSTVNGWKWVEPASISGSLYTFNFDYTKLTSSVGPGDSITYFIIAQDNQAIPNTGASIAGFPVCPPTVVLGSSAGPLNASPAPNGFKILTTPVFKATGFPGSACGSGSSVITVSPVPVGAAIQWQTAPLSTGVFTNITGATGNSYTTPVNTTTVLYRAQILCGTSVLTTSVTDTFIIANPSIVSTTGATRCGYGPLTLTVTGSPFTTGKWYTTATGGTSFFSGNSYTTPNINSSVTYYVSGNTPNAATEIVQKPYGTNYSYTAGNMYGMEFRFNNAATNFYSTTIYPWGSSSGAGTFTLDLFDSTLSTVLYSSSVISVTTGSGTTPVVVPLNFNNIPKGRYYLVMNNMTGYPGLNIEYSYPSWAWPYVSPSGNAQILSSYWGGSSYPYYYSFFYNNVVGADCESSSARVPVTATITPAPNTTVSSPGLPGICIGSCTTITGTSANPSYVYTWQPGTLTGATQTVCPTSTTTYFLTSFDPYTGCTDFDSLTINVNSVPAPPTIAPTNPLICENSSVILVGTTPPGVSGVATVGTGTITNSTYSYPSPYGQYYGSDHEQYLITAADLAAAGVKPGNLTSLAFYQNAPYSGAALKDFTIRIAATANGSITGLLTPPTHTFTTTYYNPSYNPGSTVGWLTLPFSSSFVWNGTSNIVVDVSFLNCSTCNTTASCTTAFTTNGTVNQSTTSYSSSYWVYADGNCTIPSFTPSGGNTGSMSQRPNMRFGYQKPTDINWLVTSGLYKNATLATAVTPTDTNHIVYASPKVTTAYRAVTNAQGCLSLPSAWDTVFVNPAPVVTIAPAGPQTICSGIPVALCIPTGLNQSYQWFLNNVAIAGANSNCYTAGAAGSYTVTATNIVTGCTATSIPTVLTVNVLPTVTASASGPTTFCNGGTITLTANSSTAVAWQWMLNGAPQAGATGSSYIASASGNYTVEVANSFGCKAISNVIAITVNTTPGTVTPQGPTSFCTGSSVVLQGPTSTTATLTYQWYNGAGAIAGETGSSYTATVTGNYYVIVTNTGTGCSTTSAPTQVTVGAGPSSVISPQGTVQGCQGGSVTLTAVSQTGLCYQWYLNGSSISGATSSTYTATANGSYTVMVSVCASPACTSTTTTPTVINLNTLPTASVTPTTVTPFCQGGNAVLTASGSSNVTYQWNLNGTPISGATANTINAVSNGNYTVTATSNATGCAGTSNAVTVTVYPLPTIGITTSTPTTFCQNGSVVLNATSGFGTYTWKKNGVTVITGTASSFTANSSGLYSVSVTSTNGCANTSANTSVQVNALPNVTTVPTGTTTVCQGLTTTFSLQADTAVTYQWYNGTTAIANATSNTYTTGTAGTYTVKATNTVTGCQATSAVITLAVTTPPVASVTAVGQTTFCQDDSVRLNATTGTNLTYQWKFNGNDIVGATASTYYAKLAGRYTVAVSSATGCTTLSNSILVTVNPRPAAYITYNTPLDFCDGSAVVLVANPGTGLTYQWLMDGTPTTNTTPINQVSVSGLYSLKVTNTFGCSTMSQALNVTVFPRPVPTIVRTGTTLQTAQSYTSYQWFFNNDPIGGATNGTYTFNDNGAYKVRVVDVNGCEGFSNQFFINNVGISSTAAGRSIHVYPNPTNGIVHIDASVKVKVALRDVTGKALIEASDVKEIDLGDVANGIYLLYISDMDGHLLRAEKVTKTNNY